MYLYIYMYIYAYIIHTTHDDKYQSAAPPRARVNYIYILYIYT